MTAVTDKAVATLQAQLAIASWVCQTTGTGTDAAQSFTVSRWGQARTFTGLPVFRDSTAAT